MSLHAGKCVSPSKRSVSPKTALWVLAALTASVYLHVLPYPPVYDDAHLAALRWMTPPVAHLGVLVLHLLNGVLLWHLSRRWLSETAAVIVVLLFWLHPLQTEAVTYISGGMESLLTAYTLIAVLAGLAGGLWLGLSAVALWLAMTLKFSAIPLLLIVPAIVAYDRGINRVIWLLPAISAGGIAAFFVLPSIGGLGWGPHVVHVNLAVWRYLAMIPIPYGFSVEHDWWSVPQSVGYAALSLTLAVGVFAVWVRKQWSAPFYAWLFIVGLLAPRAFTLHGEPPCEVCLTEHHTMLPFTSIWLMLGSAWDRWVLYG